MKRKRDEFKLNKNKFISYPKTNLLKLGILLILLILVALGFIKLSVSKYKKTVDIGTIDITVDTALQLTYKLSTTDYTTDKVIIYVTPKHVLDKDYDEYGAEILEELENTIDDSDELLEAKENLLLEGLNYFDIEEEWWSGEGFETLQDFVDYINNTEGSAYADIYEYMRDYNGNDESDSDEQVLDDFLLYNGDFYIKPEKYINTYARFQITKPDGTKTTADTTSEIEFIVKESGDYVFQVENGLGDKASVTIRVDNIVEEKFSGIYAQTTLYTDINGQTAWIPEGFAVGVTQVIDEIDEGLVITDAVDENGYSIGNEFVWVPVKVTSSDTKTKIASFYRSEWLNNARSTDLTTSTTCLEPNKGNQWEVTQYDEMLESVYKNGGFYIGRYEAGSTKPRTKKSNGTTEMVVKRDAYPYVYVAWGESDYTKEMTDESGLKQGYGAVYQSKLLYDSKNVGVKSTLCYSVQWDATLDFIKDEKHNVTQNNNWGNTKNNLWTINRQTAQYSNDFGESWEPVGEQGVSKKNVGTILLTTGADESFKAKNIYDICGNIFELTNEIRDNNLRVPRGNNYLDDYDGPTASYRASYYHYGASSFLGFRPALYITNE